MATTHIIRRQFMDVEFDGSESDALALQNRLLRLCQNELGPALERVFERFVAPDEHWTIDRLDIDAGSMPPGNLERLIDAVTKAVEQKLRERVPLAASPHGGTPTEWDTRAQRAPDRTGNLLPGSIEFRREAQSIQQAFLYFLETGVLPWWFQLPVGKTLEEVIHELWQRGDSGEGRPSDFARVLRDGIRSTSLRNRLVRQFSSDFLMELLSAVSDQAAVAVRDMLSTLRKYGLAELAPVEFLQGVWESAFLIAFSGRLASPDVLVMTSLQMVPRDIGEKYLSFFERIETIWPATDNRHVPKSGRSKEQGAPAKPAQLRKSTEAPRFSLDLEEGVFTPCAGVVLLHPFLPRFFEALGIADKVALLQPERALCLLHYLATGLRFAPEYDLLVPKVLCNLPLDAPVNSQIALTDAEEEESAALLEAVVRHWSALGNSSIENLRGSFLVRPGKLSQREDEHFLQVETRSYDVLLDQLPWGLGLVKLPWMQRSLWVEWRF